MTRRLILRGATVLLAGVSLLAGALYASGWSPLNAVNLLTTRAGYTIQRDIAYGELARQKLDVYEPAGSPDTGPVMVFFHGGGWKSGAKDYYLFVGQTFAAAGLTVVIPNYRIYPEAVFPSFMEDAAGAVAWVHRNLRRPDGSPRPIVLVGHSAGAHIAVLLALDERYLADARVPARAIAGTAGISGPYDFLPLEEDVYKAIFPEPVRDASQPINFVDGTEAPFLLMAGTADRTVDPGNTDRLAERITAKGGKVSLAYFEGLGHIAPLTALAEAIPGESAPVRQDILDFIAGLGVGF